MNPTALIQGGAILLGLQWLSSLILSWLNIAFPAPLLGMLLLFLLLQLGIIKEKNIEGICDLLISKMGLLFLPAGVSIILYLDIVKAEFLPIAITTLAGSFVILLGTAHFAQLLTSKTKGGKN